MNVHLYRAVNSRSTHYGWCIIDRRVIDRRVIAGCITDGYIADVRECITVGHVGPGARTAMIGIHGT